MHPTKSFDINRIGLLIKKELFYQRRAPWVIVGAVFIVLMVFHLLMASEAPGENDLPSNHVIFYILTLVFLGTIFTSAAFNELNNKSEAHHYLSIPASHLEKLISKWLVTGVLFILAFNIFYWIYAMFSNVLSSFFFDVSADMWNPFEPRQQLNGFTPFFISKFYLATHTVYLAGAVYFRKFAYFKTMIAQTVITVLVLGTIASVGYLFFRDLPNGNLAHIQITQDSHFVKAIGDVLPTIGKLMLWIVLPLWMLSFSYFKLKETEV